MFLLHDTKMAISILCFVQNFNKLCLPFTASYWLIDSFFSWIFSATGLIGFLCLCDSNSSSIITTEGTIHSWGNGTSSFYSIWPGKYCFFVKKLKEGCNNYVHRLHQIVITFLVIIKSIFKFQKISHIFFKSPI